MTPASLSRVVSVNRVDKAAWRDLFVVLVLEAALVAALHWVGSDLYDVPLRALGPWFQTTEPTVALVALARLVGLAIGYWLLATTVLYALSYHLGLDSLTRLLHWVTLPVVRHVVQGVTALSLTGATILGPSAISALPAMAQHMAVAQGDTTTSTTAGSDGSYTPGAAGWPSSGEDGSFWLPNAGLPPAAVGAQAGAESYTVVRGDNFWTIAENRIRSVQGGGATERQVARYWVKVVDANRSSIRSGDPDLIFPGERVTLPAID